MKYGLTKYIYIKLINQSIIDTYKKGFRNNNLINLKPLHVEFAPPVYVSEKTLADSSRYTHTHTQTL